MPSSLMGVPAAQADSSRPHHLFQSSTITYGGVAEPVAEDPLSVLKEVVELSFVLGPHKALLCRRRLPTRNEPQS